MEHRGDLRERSLAMYKSINNMLTLVSKKDQPITMVTPSEAEGVDFAYRELQSVGVISRQEVKQLRTIIQNVLRNSDELLIDPPPSTTNGENPPRMLDTIKLKGLLKREILQMKQLKLEQKNNVQECNYNNKVGAYAAAAQGARKTMEDQYIIITHLNELMGIDEEDFPSFSFVGVYDGHSGRAAAEYSRAHLHVNTVRDPSFKHNIREALKNAYQHTDHYFNNIAMRDGMNSGTTAVTAFITLDSIFITNVGDSEAVLCKNGKAILVSEAHLPNKEAEKERIMKSGGTVVWYGTWRVNGLLSVSRSIGDNNLKEVVIAEPHFNEVKRTSEDEFLIMATDGLWDVITYQEACDFVREHLKTQEPKDICQLLVDEAIHKKTADNVAVLIVFLLQ